MNFEERREKAVYRLVHADLPQEQDCFEQSYFLYWKE